MAVGQIPKNLMSTMHSANVTIRVVVVDPWVDGLGAPMFELNLCRCGWG
jgi:hypothetical protein